MSDHLVTVASFAFTTEAQLAKNLLESEGIPAFVAGALAADVLASAAGEAQLQVRAQDAQRAVSLLADVAAKAELADDWETQAESGVWTCSLCGTAVRLGVTVCPACRTANPGITTDRRDVQTDLDRGPRGSDQVKKGDQIQGSRPQPLLPDTEGGREARAPQGTAGCVVLILALPWLWLLWQV